jgi:hypothetical protein
MNNLKDVLEKYSITTNKKTLILPRTDDRKGETSDVVQLNLFY